MKKSNYIIHHLKDEDFFPMGSSTYFVGTDIDFTPKDIDICIKCNNSGEHYNTLCEKMESIADAFECDIKWDAEYATPFNWGGRTFSRLTIGKYDFFFVDENTFNIIKIVNSAMISMPIEIKKTMLDKDKRVDMFVYLAEMISDSNN